MGADGTEVALARVKPLFVEAAYDRRWMMDEATMLGFVVEVVHKMNNQHSFVPLLKALDSRALVRLVRDYERRIDVSIEMIYVATDTLPLKRLFGKNSFFKPAAKGSRPQTYEDARSEGATSFVGIGCHRLGSEHDVRLQLESESFVNPASPSSRMPYQLFR